MRDLLRSGSTGTADPSALKGPVRPPQSPRSVAAAALPLTFVGVEPPSCNLLPLTSPSADTASDAAPAAGTTEPRLSPEVAPETRTFATFRRTKAIVPIRSAVPHAARSRSRATELACVPRTLARSCPGPGQHRPPTTHLDHGQSAESTLFTPTRRQCGTAAPGLADHIPGRSQPGHMRAEAWDVPTFSASRLDSPNACETCLYCDLDTDPRLRAA